MADKKISQLTGATTPLAGTEVLPIVQGGSTVKVSVDNVTKGRTVNALSFDTDVAAAGVTLSGVTLSADGTDANIDINVTPKGSGEVNITKVDIDSGAIDGTVIGANSAAAGTFTRITASGIQDTINATYTQNGESAVLNVRNAANDTAASTAVFIGNNATGGAGRLQVFSSGFSTSGPNIADSFVVRTDRAGGLSLISSNAAGVMRFYTGGFSEVGRWDASGNLKIDNGNLVVGTAAKGIDFSANTGAAGETSALLNWYEEGTWTPQLSSGATDATMGANNAGRYTRIGRVVHIHAWIETSSVAGIGGGQLSIKGLPFTVNSGYSGYGGSTAGFASGLAITAGQSVSFRPGAATTELTPYVWNSADGSTIMTGTEWSDDGTVAVSLTYLI